MTDTSVPLVCKPYLTNEILSTARITMAKILKEREREKEMDEKLHFPLIPNNI